MRAAQAKHADAFAEHSKDLASAVSVDASVAHRLSGMKRLLGDSADQQAVRHSSARHQYAQKVAALESASAHHASLPESIAHLERKFG